MSFSTPIIYSMEELALEDQFELYSSEILPNVRCSQVEKALLTFVIENIEPVGWQAIWRSTERTTGLANAYDFLVEVIDVSQTALEANVELVQLLPKLADDDDEADDDVNPTSKPDEQVLKMLNKKEHKVPLLELYSVHDETTDGQFEKTAEIVEHVRFFYSHLWRPWDADDEEDYVFSNEYLLPRLKLYYEMNSGVVPSSIVYRINAMLMEAKENQLLLEELEKDMQVSDSDAELNEQDVLRCMELRMRQEELKRQMQFLENPALRALVIKKELQIKATARGKRPNSETVLHIVCSKLIAGMLHGVTESEVVEHHKSLSTAIAATYDGDRIWIYPGTYTCEGIGWLEDSVTITGKGVHPDDVMIEAKGCNDIFLNISARKVTMSNVTIRVPDNYFCALMVHCGLAVLDNCYVTNGSVGISINSTSEVHLTNCDIRDAKIAGVLVHTGAVLTMDSCTVQDCLLFGAAIEVDADVAEVKGDAGDGDESCPVKIQSCVFERNNRSNIAFYQSEKEIRNLFNAQFREIVNIADGRLSGKVSLKENHFNETNDGNISITL